ncbi:MAG: prepilin-type N-terminal cleavage/methylation domain-containing protein [candidate division Zixibacteria bacterium]
MRRINFKQTGFTLIEVLMVVIVIGIVAAVAIQSMTVSVDDARRAATMREIEMLADAIVGNSEISQNGHRSDFGYVGDIGAFPPNLQALYENPGGYATWNGPYISPGFIQDSLGFKFDEWGDAYIYGSGVSISSSGNGNPINKRIARAISDYLLNSFTGYINDDSGDDPDSALTNSVEILITIPNGVGGTVTKLYYPDTTGTFVLDSLPVGTHQLRIIYSPVSDTLIKFITIFPRHKTPQSFRFSANYFTAIEKFKEWGVSWHA